MVFTIRKKVDIYFPHILLLAGSLISFSIYIYPFVNLIIVWLSLFLSNLLLYTFLILDLTAMKESIKYFIFLYISVLLSFGIIQFLFYPSIIPCILFLIIGVIIFILYDRFGEPSWRLEFGRNYVVFSLLTFSITIIAFFGIFYTDFVLTVIMIKDKISALDKKLLDSIIASGLPAFGNLLFLSFIIWLFYSHQNLIVPREGEEVGVKLSLFMTLVQYKKYLEFDIGLIVFVILHIYSVVLSVDHTIFAIGREYVYPILGFISWVEFSSIIFLSYPLIIAPIKEISDNFVGIYDEFAINKLSKMASRASDHVIVIGHGKIGSSLTKSLYATLRDLDSQQEEKFYAPYFKTIIISNKIFVITDKVSHLNIQFKHVTGATWGLIKVEEDIYAPAFIGDGSNIEVLRTFSVERASLIVSTIGREDILDALINLSKLYGLEDKLVLIRMPTLTRQHTITTLDTLTNLHAFSTVTLLSNLSANLFTTILKYIYGKKLMEGEENYLPKILIVSSSDKVAINIRAFIRNLAKKMPAKALEDRIYVLAPFSYFKINAVKLRESTDGIDIMKIKCGGEFYKVSFFESALGHQKGDLTVNFIYGLPNSYCIYSALKSIQPEIVIVGENTIDAALGTISDLLISILKLENERNGEYKKPHILTIYPSRDENILNLIEKYHELVVDKDYPRSLRDGHVEGLGSIEAYLKGIIDSYLLARKYEDMGFITLNLTFRDNYLSLLQILSKLAGLEVIYDTLMANSDTSGKENSNLNVEKDSNVGDNEFEMRISLFDNISMRSSSGFPDIVNINLELINTSFKTRGKSGLSEQYKNDLWAAIIANYVQTTPKYKVLENLLEIKRMEVEGLEAFWTRIDELSTAGATLETIYKFKDLRNKAIITDYVYLNPHFPKIDDDFSTKVEEVFEITNFYEKKDEENRIKTAACDLRIYTYPGAFISALADLNKLNIREDKNRGDLIFDIKSLYIKEIYTEIQSNSGSANKLKLKDSEFHGIILNRSEALDQVREILAKSLIIKELSNHCKIRNKNIVKSIRECAPAIQAIRILPVNQFDEWKGEIQEVVKHMNNRISKLSLGHYVYVEKEKELLVFLDPLIKSLDNSKYESVIKVKEVTPGVALFLLDNNPSSPFTYIVPRVIVSPSIIELYQKLEKCDSQVNEIDCVEGRNRFTLVKISFNRYMTILEKTDYKPLYIFVPAFDKTHTDVKKVKKALIPEYYWNKEDIYKIVILPIKIREFTRTLEINLEKSNILDIYKELGIAKGLRDKIEISPSTLSHRAIDVIEFYRRNYERIKNERIRLFKRREYWPNMTDRLDRLFIEKISRWDATTFTLAEKVFFIPSIMPPDVTALPYTTTKRYLYESPHLMAL